MFCDRGAVTCRPLFGVVDDLMQSLAQLSAIDIALRRGNMRRAVRHGSRSSGITPDNVFVVREGKWCTAHGWQGASMRKTILRLSKAAGVDVPDLELLPVRYPGVQTVSFRAALEVSLQHHLCVLSSMPANGNWRCRWPAGERVSIAWVLGLIGWVAIRAE